MNKYTLTFFSKELELEYQISRQKYTNPALKIMNALIIPICIIRVITYFLQGQILLASLFILFPIAALIAQLIILNYKKQWADYYLFICNHGLMIYQIYASVGNFEPTEAYNFGQAQMILHVIVFLISDFQNSTFQIITHFILQTLLGYLYQSNINYQTIIYSVIAHIILCIANYQIKLQYRNSFLYNSTVKSSEQFFPLLIDTPFFICLYDEGNVQFKSICSNFDKFSSTNKYHDNTKNMIVFLRNYLIYGQTFEEFLLKRKKIQNLNILTNKQITLKSKSNNQDNILIRYSEYYATQLIFIIIIDQKQHQLSKLIKRTIITEKGIRLFGKKIQSFLIKILKKIDTNDIQQFYYSKTQLIYLLTKFNIFQKNKLEEIQLINQFQQFSKLFINQIKLHINSTSNYISIITYKQPILDMIIILLTHINQTNRECDLNCYEQDEYIKITIMITYSQKLFTLLLKNKQFLRILKEIGPYDKPYQQGEQIINIFIYKNINMINQQESYFKR